MTGVQVRLAYPFKRANDRFLLYQKDSYNS